MSKSTRCGLFAMAYMALEFTIGNNNFTGNGRGSRYVKFISNQTELFLVLLQENYVSTASSIDVYKKYKL
jgi:hypothetical protein